VERVILNGKATRPGDFLLAALDFFVIKFVGARAVDAHRAVVMLAGLDLEHRLA